MQTPQARERIAVALDVPGRDRAVELAAALAPEVGMFKVGLELFCAGGPAVVKEIGQHGPVFLDLKFHDIPNTVEGAAARAAAMGVAMFTVHAVGGAAMIGAAVRGAHRGASEPGGRTPLVVAVTVLSSGSASDRGSVALGLEAVGAGADGLVVSGADVAAVRGAVGPSVTLVVPGIRPPGSDPGDQVRVLTPRDALAAGADLLVVGRPITGSDDPAAAAQGIVASLR